MASVKKVKTAHGDRWVVRWRVDGRPVKRSLRSAEAADALRIQVESDALAGVALDPRRGARKLDDYFDGWLATRIVKGRPLAANTAYGYRSIWDRNIADALGSKQLRQVDRSLVREWHGKLTADKSADQAAKAYRLLHAVFATAVSDELVRVNPVLIRGGGMEHQAERPFVPTPLVLQIADRIGDRVDKATGNVVGGDGRYRALVLLVAFAALRTSEVLALRRCDVDILHREVTVRRQAHEIAGRRVEVDHTKSDAGMRIVDLPNLVATGLDTHLALFVAEGADAPVFTGPGGGPLTRKVLSRTWRAACGLSGAPDGLRLYDLRHHAATLTARKPGITTKELMSRIGHSTVSAALRYQHATRERDREIADFIDDVVAAAKPEPSAPVVDGRARFAPSGGAGQGDAGTG